MGRRVNPGVASDGEPRGTGYSVRKSTVERGKRHPLDANQREADYGECRAKPIARSAADNWTPSNEFPVATLEGAEAGRGAGGRAREPDLLSTLRGK